MRTAMFVLCLCLLLVSSAFAAWDPLNSGVVGPLYSVHFPEGTQVGYAVGAGMDSLGGDVGLVLKTTSGGDTWEQQDPGPYVRPLRSVYFKDNSNGYAVGEIATAIRTTDGGATWIPMTVPGADMLTYVRFPGNGMVGYIGVYPRVQAGRVLKSTDGGDNWTIIAVGGSTDWTRSCAFVTDSVGVVLGNAGFVVGIPDSLWQGDVQTNADLVAAAFSRDVPSRGYLIGNDTTLGVIRYTDDYGTTPWDSVRCWTTRAFYGVDMPTSEAAYVCGTDGIILRSVMSHDFYRSASPTTADMYGLCFPNGVDTGYAVGAGGVILRTYDRGGFPHWVAEEKGPATGRAGIRIVFNPSRHGITFHADACVDVVVFDATGRVVGRCVAAKGLNFLPLSKVGVYIVRARTDGQSTTQKVVVER
jgi:photosystem II stability/assembly factor-like uncharacterized protein